MQRINVDDVAQLIIPRFFVYLYMVKQNSYILDFVIQSRPLTKKQEKELTEYIAKRKLEIKKQKKENEKVV
jgi:hypothetical protein